MKWAIRSLQVISIITLVSVGVLSASNVYGVRSSGPCDWCASGCPTLDPEAFCVDVGCQSFVSCEEKACFGADLEWYDYAVTCSD
jgi:hypothetical protein